jgi:hypothetical protein
VTCSIKCHFFCTIKDQLRNEIPSFQTREAIFFALDLCL